MLNHLIIWNLCLSSLSNRVITNHQHVWMNACIHYCVLKYINNTWQLTSCKVVLYKVTVKYVRQRSRISYNMFSAKKICLLYNIFMYLPIHQQNQQRVFVCLNKDHCRLLGSKLNTYIIRRKHSSLYSYFTTTTNFVSYILYVTVKNVIVFYYSIKSKNANCCIRHHNSAFNWIDLHREAFKMNSFRCFHYRLWKRVLIIHSNILG